MLWLRAVADGASPDRPRPVARAVLNRFKGSGNMLMTTRGRGQSSRGGDATDAPKARSAEGPASAGGLWRRSVVPLWALIATLLTCAAAVASEFDRERSGASDRRVSDLGLRLMDTWKAAPQPLHKVTRYRNGLLIALLISCPIRLKNLAGLVIGRHLICDGNDYRIELTAEETKTGRPHVADLPRELSPYIDRWLQVHRPSLQMTATVKATTDDHLWLDYFGKPMSARTIQRAIAWWTEQAFGKAIRPHLFRDCAVTELVDVAPEQVGIAADLLGHADFRTTRKHYIQAHGMTAHVRVQEMIARRRAAAARGVSDA